jgi:hypothetical protein
MPSKKLTTVAAEPTREVGAIQVEVTLPVRPRRQESDTGGQPDSISGTGRRPQIPRITRLMALAIKFQAMVERREVRDYADLARLGYVTRARLTQIMNLLLLAPDIQERVLFGIQSSGCTEKALRVICAQVYWPDQRSRFGDV